MPGMRYTSAVLVALALALPGPALESPSGQGSPFRFSVRLPASMSTAVDGRLLLIVSRLDGAEPRFQVSDGAAGQPVFGIDVDEWTGNKAAVIDETVLGFPLDSIGQIPAGTYTVQALLHRYETFNRGDGHRVRMPMDRGEGQQWAQAPGNLFSTPKKVTFDPKKGGTIDLTLDQVIPPIEPAKDSKYIKHERIQSALLTKFWGRPMHLGANVLLPEGWETHPEARYPLFIYHGHFPHTFEGFREEPPNPNLKPDYSSRFRLEGYNRIQEQYAHQFYKDWTGPGFPRAIVIEIQHPTPFYDDSYAVNSANSGPYGDAIVNELLPYIEKKYRAIGQGWSRFMYGGSTGGWEAMADQVFYPDVFNGAYIACPDPIDFRAYTVIDLYKDKNAYFLDDTWKKTPRPGLRDYLGHISSTVEELNRLELVLGTKTRSGQQFDVWESTFSPVGPDGYPARIWDKRKGVIDKKVAEYWREHYDLSAILRRDWDKGLGKKLEGKLHIYVGDMDNYFLNNAVYLVEEFLESTKNPYYNGEVAYGDRAEHCWNGDPSRPNALSRLRYQQMFIPKAVKRMEATAPAGADLKSWRY
jgi:hypothetical protein